ncbi:hypothetical protein HDU96_009941 [Phlyctochytrium bullatum]|nr:hypothetical protein HDU96_009941 [Phlyctochytrium bullatum]
MNVAIVLFRNDLRLHDNPTLHLAATFKSITHLLPVYVFDPRQINIAPLNGRPASLLADASLRFEEPLTWHFKFPKCGSHRARFIAESVQDLQHQLRSRNSDLLLAYGRPENILPALLRAVKSAHPTAKLGPVFLQQEATYEETSVEDLLEKNLRPLNVTLRKLWGSTVIHRDDLPFSIADVPEVFTSFRKRVEAIDEAKAVRAAVPVPELRPLPDGLTWEALLGPQDAAGLVGPLAGQGKMDPRTAFPFRGGEKAALDRLQNFLWTTRAVDKYKETRNGLEGSEYSSKFSPWLAVGALSPRHVVHELQRVERARGSNDGTYWLWFELLWRDYFKFVALKHGNKIFFLNGFSADKNLEWKQDMVTFGLWRDGKTGIPWVDANMIELKLTGFMSNRGRQNVASFLAKDLLLDWRLGAELFESLLLDHDPCSNYLNWQYVAGVGNDPRENRRFNMLKQAKDYDPQGSYVRRWIPELAKLGAEVHAPWRVGNGKAYLSPLVLRPEWEGQFGRADSGKRGGNKGEKAVARRGRGGWK